MLFYHLFMEAFTAANGALCVTAIPTSRISTLSFSVIFINYFTQCSSFPTFPLLVIVNWLWIGAFKLVWCVLVKNWGKWNRNMLPLEQAMTWERILFILCLLNERPNCKMVCTIGISKNICFKPNLLFFLYRQHPCLYKIIWYTGKIFIHLNCI